MALGGSTRYGGRVVRSRNGQTEFERGHACIDSGRVASCQVPIASSISSVSAVPDMLGSFGGDQTNIKVCVDRVPRKCST